MPMGEIQPEPDRIYDSLKSLGLTKYEALVYMALLQVQGATATEIHEISKVPRASVYPVIDKLISKNLVSTSNTTPKRFSATPPEAAVKNMLGEIKKDADNALKALNELYESRPERPFGKQEYIWSITGEENILLKLKEALNSAEKEVFFAARWDFIKNKLSDITESVSPDVKIEIITNNWDKDGYPGIFPNASVKIFKEFNSYSRGTKNGASGVYIIDKKKVLLIMDSDADLDSASFNPPALYSESYGFVQFFLSYREFISGHLESLQKKEKISA